MDEPTYSPEDVSTLLRVASERQAAADRRAQAEAPSERALTLGEVEQVAAEAGIDPQHVREAARADGPGHTPPPASPGTVGERLVEGTLSDGQWEALVVALRERFDATGTVSHFGTRREWSAKGIQDSARGTAGLGPLPDLHLEVRQEEGMTRLRFTDRSLSQRATLGTVAASLLALGVVMATVEAVDGGFTTITTLLSLLLIVACTLGAYQWTTARWKRERAQRLEDALDHAEQLCNRRDSLTPDRLSAPPA